MQVCRGVLGLFSPDASSILLPVGLTKNVSRHCQMFPGDASPPLEGLVPFPFHAEQSSHKRTEEERPHQAIFFDVNPYGINVILI